MRKLHIVGIGGTLSKHSKSLSALKFALSSAEAAGASTDLIDLREANLPIFDPEQSLSECPEVVQSFIKRSRAADGMIWSTGGYHGTLAGVTKNAIDYFEYLEDDDRPYLHTRAIGLIATTGGGMAGVNALSAMVHSVHALRGTVVPLQIAIPQASTIIDRAGTISSEKWRSRLEKLGVLIVDFAARLQVAFQSDTANTGNPS